MKYSSKTLAELQSLLQQLNKADIFPYNYSAEIAERSGIEINNIRNALKGNAAAPTAARAVVEAAESLLKIKPPKTKPRALAKLSITDLYEQSLLPAKYSEIAAEIANVKPATVRNFIRNKRLGRESYASSQPISDALFQIAAMNEEWELKCRAERALEKIVESTAPSAC